MSSLVKLMPLVWGPHIKNHCHPWDFGESYAILCVWSFSHQAVSLWFVHFSICMLYLQKINNNNNLKSQYDLLVSSLLSEPIAHGCPLSPWHDCHSLGATSLAPSSSACAGTTAVSCVSVLENNVFTSFCPAFFFSLLYRLYEKCKQNLSCVVKGTSVYLLWIWPFRHVHYKSARSAHNL